MDFQVIQQSVMDFFESDRFVNFINAISPFEYRVFFLIGLLVMFFSINGVVMLTRNVRRKAKSKSKAPKSLNMLNEISDLEVDTGKPNKTLAKASKPSKFRSFFKSFFLFKFFRKIGGFFWRKKLIILNGTLGILFVAVVAVTVLVRPRIINSTPSEGSYMSSGEEIIEVEFDVPVNTDEIKFNVSPEVEGDWVFEEAFPGSPVKRKARFYPKESFYPESEVVVYVVGMKQSWSGGKEHEQAIEFKSPKIPDIEEIYPEVGSVDVPTDVDVEIKYDAPVGDFVDLKYEMDPKVEFDVKTTEENIQVLDFKEDLDQDQEYKIDIYRTPRSYDVDNGKDVEIGDTEKIEELVFRTVTTPLVKSYEPKGKGILVDKVIKVVFDQPMNQESVLDHFKITPDTEGTVTWEDETTFVFTPDQDLKKGTDYEILFSKGILSEVSGTTEEEIKLKFTTIGKVKVSSVSPILGASGLHPNSTNIVVEFNQKVDHASAQSKFSISPSVSGAFSWDGNKMIYSVAGKLKYSTKYTFSIAAGVKTIHGLDSAKTFSYSFTTRANIFTLNVPWYKQQENFTCNIAATRMALAYRGVYRSESQIKSGIGIGTNPNSDWVSGYGVHWGPVASYIGQYRKVSIKQGWNVSALAKEVEKGNPVILFWYNRYSQPPGAFTLPSGATGYKGMHSEVVYGFIGDSSNPTSLMTNDPWRGRLTYSKSGFVNTWAYINYTAVVVY